MAEERGSTHRFWRVELLRMLFRSSTLEDMAECKDRQIRQTFLVCKFFL